VPYALGEAPGDEEEKEKAHRNKRDDAPVCVVLAGYLNGFLRCCMEQTGTSPNLGTVEVCCRANGAPNCQFLTANAEALQSHVAEYLPDRDGDPKEGAAEQRFPLLAVLQQIRRKV